MDGSYSHLPAQNAARFQQPVLAMPLSGRQVGLAEWLGPQQAANSKQPQRQQEHSDFEGLHDDPTREPAVPTFGRRRKWGDTGIWRVSFVPLCREQLPGGEL